MDIDVNIVQNCLFRLFKRGIRWVWFCNALQFVLKVYLFTVPESIKQQYNDNIRWIKMAGQHKMVISDIISIIF